jgi:hypothetical protein
VDPDVEPRERDRAGEQENGRSERAGRRHQDERGGEGDRRVAGGKRRRRRVTDEPVEARVLLERPIAVDDVLEARSGEVSRQHRNRRHEEQAEAPPDDRQAKGEAEPERAQRPGVRQADEHRVEPVDAVLYDPRLERAVEHAHRESVKGTGLILSPSRFLFDSRCYGHGLPRRGHRDDRAHARLGWPHFGARFEGLPERDAQREHRPQGEGEQGDAQNRAAASREAPCHGR